MQRSSCLRLRSSTAPNVLTFIFELPSFPSRWLLALSSRGATAHTFGRRRVVLSPRRGRRLVSPQRHKKSDPLGSPSTEQICTQTVTTTVHTSLRGRNYVRSRTADRADSGSSVASRS